LTRQFATTTTGKVNWKEPRLLLLLLLLWLCLLLLLLLRRMLQWC
jgi:hypothetical protein